MTLGDFSSLVQLGVGIHAGTALLQLFSEFGTDPLERRLGRIENFLSRHEKANVSQQEEAEDLKSALSIFRIRTFAEYKHYVAINFGVAIGLAFALVLISFLYTQEFHWLLAMLLSISCVGPATWTTAMLWKRAMPHLNGLRNRVAKLETEVFPRAAS